jgi:hypothetical protein
MKNRHKNCKKAGLVCTVKCARYYVERLETRILLDASPYAFTFRTSSNNIYSYNINQTVTFAGQVIDSSGAGVPDVVITAHDGFQKTDRLLGTTDSSGDFSFTDAATQVGNIDVQLDGYLDSSLVSPIWVHYNVNGTGSPSHVATGLQLVVGPGSGIEDATTQAISAKSDPITTPAVISASSSIIGPVLGEFAQSFLEGFLSDPVNDIAIVGAATCLVPTIVTQATICPVSLSFLEQSAAKQAAISAWDVAIDNSAGLGVSSQVRDSLKQGLQNTSMVTDVMGLDDSSGVLDYSDTELELLQWEANPQALTDAAAPEISNWNTTTNTGRFDFTVVNPTGNGVLIVGVAVSQPVDTSPPTATVHFPVAASTVAQSLINSSHYIDVTFGDAGGSGLDLSTILDSGEEFSINGITINGSPTLVSGTTYRYSFTGTLPVGSINVNFLAGTWADNQGNLSQAFTQAFNVSAQPVITAVTPSVLLPLPASQTQLITLSGSGFSANSTLDFVSTLGNSYTGRVPLYNASNGQLGYYISVGTATGQWSVQVITDGVASAPDFFTVSSLPPVATPTISPSGGSFNNSVEIYLSTSTLGATIYYTLDGTTPTLGSAVYTGPLTLNTSATVNADAVEAGMPTSAVTTATFTVTPVPLAPVITSGSPTLLQPTNNDQSLTIYGSGFQPSAVVHLYNPSGTYVGDATTTYISSGILDCVLNVASVSGNWSLVEENTASGQSSNSSAFTVAQPPTGNYPVQTFPANGATGIATGITFTWQSVAGASDYQMVLADSASLLPGSPDDWNATTGGQTQEYVGRYLNSGETYYWAVRAEINGVWNGWSPIWSFTIAGELYQPPVVQSGAATPTTVTQGDTFEVTANGVSDPNLPPDQILYVTWYVESNGQPGLQPIYPNADWGLVTDSNGADGWSANVSTFGSGVNNPLTPGTHTLYAVALDSHGDYSLATSLNTFTVTILPAAAPAPVVESVRYAQGASAAEVLVAFNTNVGPSLGPGEFIVNGPGSPTVEGVTYDPSTNVATLTLNTPTLSNGYYELTAFSSEIYNAAGVTLSEPAPYLFSVLQGDVNGDGTVDSQDYTILLQNLNAGSGKGWADGDFNGDGIVNDSDLQILETNMGQTLSPLAGAPNQPQNQGPSDQSTGTLVAPVLQASAFSDPTSGNTQVAADWVVTRVSDSIVVFNSGQDPTDLTSVSLGSLSYNTTYSWKVRYLNNQGIWSAYSDSTTFTTEGPPVLVSDTWMGPTGGSWYTPSNWSAGELPQDVTNVVINSGNVFAEYPFTIGSLVINSGTLQLVNNNGFGPYSVSSLTLGSGATLDLANNELLVDFGNDSDPKTQILSDLKSGYNHGTWSGHGIVSSYAGLGGGEYGIAFADGADGVVSGLASGQVELKYTLNGDANLDGAVNGTDFAILAGNFNKSVSNGWEQGDFNYDGAVNGTDFAELAANFNKGANLNPPGISPGVGAQYTISGAPGAQTLDILSGTVTLTSDMSGLLAGYSLQIEDGARVVLSSDQHVASLQLNGTGSLDVSNYTVFINYGANTDPIAAIAGNLKSGYNGEGWNGPGIFSSAAAANPGYALGYADGADGVVSGLSSGQIEIRYTLVGDANLDGAVNGTDFAILAANFNKAVSGWDKGDFDYNGAVNGTDFAGLAANFNKGASNADVVTASVLPDETTVLATSNAQSTQSKKSNASAATHLVATNKTQRIKATPTHH